MENTICLFFRACVIDLLVTCTSFGTSKYGCHVCVYTVVLALQGQKLLNYQNQLYMCLQQMYLDREEKNDCLI